jgi:pimeloyl-ACP methyl ester carboxylesterase
MPFADANGHRIYYEVEGDGEPLLCVMGLGADHLGFALQQRELKQHLKVIVFDNRDVGQSSYAEGEYEVIDMAGDAMALADELGLDSFHLLGESLGGAIAQEMALGWPDRVETLTLAVTWASGGPWMEKRSRLRANAAERAPAEERIDELMLLAFSEQLYEEEPERVTYMRRLMLEAEHPQRIEGFKRQLLAAGRHEARRRLPSLRMPVHVIGAEHDVLVPVWKSKEIADLIPGAKLTILPEAAHAVNIERAEEFNRVVLDFIRSERKAAA